MDSIDRPAEHVREAPDAEVRQVAKAFALRDAVGGHERSQAEAFVELPDALQSLWLAEIVSCSQVNLGDAGLLRKLPYHGVHRAASADHVVQHHCNPLPGEIPDHVRDLDRFGARTALRGYCNVDTQLAAEMGDHFRRSGIRRHCQDVAAPPERLELPKEHVERVQEVNRHHTVEPAYLGGMGSPGDEAVDSSRQGEIRQQPGRRGFPGELAGFVLAGVRKVRKHGGHVPGPVFPKGPGGQKKRQVVLIHGGTLDGVVQALQKKDVAAPDVLREPDCGFRVGEAALDFGEQRERNARFIVSDQLPVARGHRPGHMAAGGATGDHQRSAGTDVFSGTGAQPRER